MSSRGLKVNTGTLKHAKNVGAKPVEQETNIDFAYGLARQLSREKKEAAKKAANTRAIQAANNKFLLEYPDVDLAAMNKASSNKKKAANKVTHRKKKPLGANMKMHKLFASNS